MNKAILYFSNNSMPVSMEIFFQRKLNENSNGIPIFAVMNSQRSEYSKNFAYKNIICKDEKTKGWNDILKKMKLGIDNIINNIGDNTIVYIAEHDVLYNNKYFDDYPKSDDIILKNKNLFFCNQFGFWGPFNTHIHSQTIASALLLYKCLEGEGVDGGKFKTENGFKLELYNSFYPNIDIRHGFNATGWRDSKKGYIYNLPFWGNHKTIISNIPEFKYKNIKK